jgi:hypothetical protein
VILRPAKILAENENLFLSYPDDLDDRNYLESLTDELKSYIEKTLSKKTGNLIKIVIDSKKSENKVKVEDILMILNQWMMKFAYSRFDYGTQPRA